MSCSQCRGNGGCRSCKNQCSPKDSINWLMPVEKLPLPQYATRRYMYLLPSNTVHILNYDGTGFIQLVTDQPEVIHVEGVE